MWVISEDGYAVNLRRVSHLRIYDDGEALGVAAEGMGGKLDGVNVIGGLSEEEANNLMMELAARADQDGIVRDPRDLLGELGIQGI